MPIPGDLLIGTTPDDNDTGGLIVAGPGSPPGALVEKVGHLQFGRLLTGGSTVLRWINLTGWRSRPASDITDAPRPSSHGDRPGTMYAQGAIVTYDCLLRGTQASKIAALDELDRHTPISDVEQQLVVDDGSGPSFRWARVIDLEYQQGVAFRPGPVPITIVFKCADPRRYSLAAKSVRLDLPSSVGGLDYSEGGVLEYRWTGTPNTSSSEKLTNGTVTRTNIGTNPRAISTGGGWTNQSGATYATAFVTSGFPAHPLGITTAQSSHVLDTATTPNAARILSPDNIAAAGSPARRLGVWVCSIAAGYQMVAYAGFPATPLTAGVWTFVQQTSTWPAGAASTFAVSKITGNAVSTDMVYVTGCVTEAGDVVGDYFDGSTPDVTGGLNYTPGLDYGIVTVGSALVTNDGNVATPASALLRGPLTNPRIRIDGKSWSFLITLVAGDQLSIDGRTGQVLLNGSADRSQTLTDDSDLLDDFTIEPGTTTAALTAANGAGFGTLSFNDARM